MASQALISDLSSDDLDSVDPNLQIRGADSITQMSLDVDISAKGPVSHAELEIAEIQILLDRAGFSPGVINGADSMHFRRVLDLYQKTRELAEHGVGPALIEQMSSKGDGDAFEDYVITSQDIIRSVCSRHTEPHSGSG